MTAPLNVFAVRDEAPGAWPNGTRVLKANSQPTDGTPNGTEGRIVGSVDVSNQGLPARFAYFVIWATRPELPVLCVDTNNDGTPRLELKP